MSHAGLGTRRHLLTSPPRKDTRAEYVPAHEEHYWKRFSDEIRQGYGNDDLTTRKNSSQRNSNRSFASTKRVFLPAGTDTRPASTSSGL